MEKDWKEEKEDEADCDCDDKICQTGGELDKHQWHTKIANGERVQ